jgi:hypothetical protein
VTDDVSPDAGAGEYADPAKLTDRPAGLPEADVDLPGGMGVVRVRGLSRAEALEVQKIADAGTLMLERRMLALAMVRPRMSEGKVREWQEVAPAGELEPVTDKVQELSGMAETSAKDIYRRLDADPSDEFRLLPGSETGDDRGAPERDDV